VLFALTIRRADGGASGDFQFSLDSSHVSHTAVHRSDSRLRSRDAQRTHPRAHNHKTERVLVAALQPVMERVGGTWSWSQQSSSSRAEFQKSADKLQAKHCCTVSESFVDREKAYFNYSTSILPNNIGRRSRADLIVEDAWQAFSQIHVVVGGAEPANPFLIEKEPFDLD